MLRTADELEARFLSDDLGGAGIEAAILSQKDSTNVVTFGGLSVVRVMVPAYLLEEARAWIENRESGSETGGDRG
ncbi:MAG: putative signal transducing protein [Gemmatimonadota bacterium]